MPGKIEQYIAALNSSADWIPYLRSNSGLPGPRGNLELAQAVACNATREQLDTLLAIDKTHPEENTPDTFVVFCGVRGQGKFAADDPDVRQLLRRYASDPRWRIEPAGSPYPSRFAQSCKFDAGIRVNIPSALKNCPSPANRLFSSFSQVFHLKLPISTDSGANLRIG